MFIPLRCLPFWSTVSIKSHGELPVELIWLMPGFSVGIPASSTCSLLSGSSGGGRSEAGGVLFLGRFIPESILYRWFSFSVHIPLGNVNGVGLGSVRTLLINLLWYQRRGIILLVLFTVGIKFVFLWAYMEHAFK